MPDDDDPQVHRPEPRAGRVATSGGAMTTETTPERTTRPRRETTADRLVRQLLRIEDAAPRSIVSLKGSLILTAVRCILMYAVIPALAPLVGWLGVLARPLSIAMSLAAIGLAIYSLRRVWLADWHRRWAYTGFIAVVVTLLVVVIGFDVRAMLT